MTQAMLMVAMEPPATLEEEFQDWYDTEHLPQRKSLPGFLSATRWVCVDGWPRWMAIYELESRETLNSEAYRQVSGANSTPWSRRVLPKTVGRLRVIADQADSISATFDDGGISRLLVASIRLTAGTGDQYVAAVLESLAPRAGFLFLRAFREPNADETLTLWLAAAFDGVEHAAALAEVIGRPAGHALATFNLFVPYRRSSY